MAFTVFPPLAPLGAEQQRRRQEYDEVRQRLRPIHIESDCRRMARSSPEELQRDIDLMQRAGVTGGALSLAVAARDALIADRRAKYGPDAA